MADHQAMTETAKLWGVGVGPGDPELLTLKAHRIITSADVIAYPAPSDGDSLARSIVSEYLSGTQEEIVIRISMDPASFPPRDIYTQAVEEIGGHTKNGKSVAILCEGDPFFYGSFMYMFEKLAELGPVEVIPGVSSMMASAAALQTPLASRNDVVCVIPATLEADDIQTRLEAADMAVFIKVGRHLAKVRSVLQKSGLLEDAHYIERATMTAEQRSPLSEIQSDTAPYFSMILVHRRGKAL
jgi:precorrin-2/cobalt-factor-2 C20-methyltransferase